MKTAYFLLLLPILLMQDFRPQKRSWLLWGQLLDFILVPEVGIEPTRGHPRWILRYVGMTDFDPS